ncbi:hypothetical protein WR25_15940 [Diploscapter pachys]|uniref:Uncharacterized protein n=1 Tax=Diploscapter pachys TaxID=2018661 RepID=A0A2A2LMT3_9BILA|nr:hypothetical protein WR25_15940 [Diploscapter pachys]
MRVTTMRKEGGRVPEKNQCGTVGRVTLKCADSDNVAACKEEYDEKVTVEIRLPKVDYYIYSEIEAMTFNRFVSYLGGLLGILSGIQVITFIEFFVLFWRLFLVAVTNKAYV